MTEAYSSNLRGIRHVVNKTHVTNGRNLSELEAMLTNKVPNTSVVDVEVMQNKLAQLAEEVGLDIKMSAVAAPITKKKQATPSVNKTALEEFVRNSGSESGTSVAASETESVHSMLSEDARPLRPSTVFRNYPPTTPAAPLVAPPVFSAPATTPWVPDGGYRSWTNNSTNFQSSGAAMYDNVVSRGMYGGAGMGAKHTFINQHPQDHISIGLEQLQPTHIRIEEQVARAEQYAQAVDEAINLRQQCIRLRMDVTHMPTINYDTPESTVISVRNSLQKRLRAARYVNYTEDFMLEFASALGDMFNGEWTLFGDFRPDFRDLRNSVNVRISRLRPSTQAAVASSFGDMSFGGAWGDIFFEWGTAMASTAINAHRKRKKPIRYNDQQRSTLMVQYAQNRDAESKPE